MMLDVLSSEVSFLVQYHAFYNLAIFELCMELQICIILYCFIFLVGGNLPAN